MLSLHVSPLTFQRPLRSNEVIGENKKCHELFEVVRNGHNEWQKNIVKSELTDSYGSSDSNTEAFIESSAKMLPDKR